MGKSAQALPTHSVRSGREHEVQPTKPSSKDRHQCVVSARALPTHGVHDGRKHESQPIIKKHREHEVQPTKPSSKDRHQRVVSARALPTHGVHDGRKHESQPTIKKHPHVDYNITHSSKREAQNCWHVNTAIAHAGIPKHHHDKVFEYVVGGFSILGAIAGVLALIAML